MTCPNCGGTEVRRYCADCGQAAPTASDYSLRKFAADSIDQIASVDGRATRTVKTLLTRPGVLTADHMRGRRATYLRPLQLFLLVNVLLFVVAPRVPLFSYGLNQYLRFAPPSPAVVARLVERAAPTGMPARATYAAAFDGRVEAQRKSLILIFAPVLALVLRILFAVRAGRPDVPRRYGEHLVFALHFLSFSWLVITGWGVIAAIAGAQPVGPVVGLGIMAVITAMLLAAFVYVMRAVRRVYDLTEVQSIAATVVLVAAFVGLLIGYRGLLFFTTYYTL